MNLQFREPEDINELESLFRLRHKVYLEDSLLYPMVYPDSTLDINWFDMNALHFAGFNGTKPIAYMRIVTSSETSFSDWVRTIAEKNNIVLEKRNSEFPFQFYYSDEKWSENFLKQLNGKKSGEVGKLAIHKDYRRGGVVLKNLIESFIHYCKEEKKFDIGFGSCMLSLERYYRQFGFERAEGAVPFISEGLPEAVMVKFDREKIIA